MNKETIAEAMRFLRQRQDERRATIRQIIFECPKLSGEPSADCVGALSGVAVSEALALLRHLAQAMSAETAKTAQPVEGDSPPARSEGCAPTRPPISEDNL